MREEYVGALLLVSGVILTLTRRKRQFDRTNRFGIEQFPGYWDKLLTIFMDRLLCFTSLLLLSAGLLILGFRFEDSWGWIITFPVYIFMLYLLFGS